MTKRDFVKDNLALLAAGVLGFILYLILYPGVTGMDAVVFKHDREQIRTIAQEFLEDQGLKLEGLTSRVFPDGDNQQFSYLVEQVGFEEAKRLIRDNEVYEQGWRVIWYDLGKPKFIGDQEIITVHLTTWGTIFRMFHQVPDSAKVAENVDYDKALAIAEKYLLQYHDVDLVHYELESSSASNETNEHSFVWKKLGPAIGEAVSTLEVTVRGEQISKFKNLLDIPKEYQDRFQGRLAWENFSYFGSTFGLFFILIFVAVLFLKKYHQGEIGVRHGLYVFALLLAAGIALTLNVVLAAAEGANFGAISRLQNTVMLALFMVFFGNFVVALMGFISWCLGESEARKPGTTSRMLFAIDGIMKGRLFTYEAGASMIRGYFLCFTSMGIITLVCLIAEKFTGGWFVLDNPFGGYGVFDIFVLSVMVVLPVLTGLYNAVFNETLYRLFFITFFKRKFNKTVVAIVLSAVVFAVLNPIPAAIRPYYFNYIISFLIGLLMAWAFIRYGLLTTIVGFFLLEATNGLTVLLLADNATFLTYGFVNLGVFLIPLIWGLIGIARKQFFEFKSHEVPAHIKRITERARMTKELEIAKSVQLGLLPSRAPEVVGFDIAGICIPALEVGGDYYDFVSLGDQRLGIAIGDVSGKGVPAAIYMTLTKGILQSNAEEGIEPRQVLMKVNNLMYRTIKRGTFVSMIYAVLDLKKKTLSYSRAGHNPVMIIRRQTSPADNLFPEGMALGLDAGPLFDKTLQQQELELKTGDMIVLYTDGFTEAMNSANEEYSEERLLAVIEKGSASGLGSREMIDFVFSDVRKFTGSHPQNDDMTMVVVRIN